MKKLSLLLAVVMLLNCVNLAAAFAEEPAAHRFTSYDQVNAAITIIPGTDTQKELGYLEGVTPILEADGLKFKDLNKNGTLDVYEDWRQDIDARVWDLIGQMTLEEKAGLFYHVNTCGNPQGVDFANAEYMFGTAEDFGTPEEPADGASANPAFATKSMWYYINALNITTHLDNTNGTPAQQIVYHNAMQALGEDTRLGIPVVISNDRQYNAWGGMIDTAHDAFGAANDVELSKKLWTIYSLESRAVGIHVVLHPYSQELGSWNGEDPLYAGTMTKAEVASIQVEGGTEACIKHFIARGGDSSFQNARSEAQTVENWMTAWKLALESNPYWLMTNGYGTGLSNTVHVDYDKETMDYLRNILGYLSTDPADDPARTEYHTKDFLLYLITDGEYYDTAFDRSMVAKDYRERFISKGMDGGEDVLTEGYEAKAVASTTGYIWECKIAWANFANKKIEQYTPASGDTVKFDIAFTDISYPCPGTEYIPQIAWCGNQGINTNPSTWGNLIFE